MLAKIEQWEDDLGVRIPRSVAELVHLGAGTAVNVVVENGRLVIAPGPADVFNLAELLAQVTRENRHGETQMGPPVGGEVW